MGEDTYGSWMCSGEAGGDSLEPCASRALKEDVLDCSSGAAWPSGAGTSFLARTLVFVPAAVADLEEDAGREEARTLLPLFEVLEVFEERADMVDVSMVRPGPTRDLL
jgi:hypothetical protein